MQSLFAALRTYRPRPGRDSLEDFITEAWCWLLTRFPSLAEAVLRKIWDLAAGGGPHVGRFVPDKWQTQVTASGSRFDMIAERAGRGIVFEHKVWSSLGGDQLGKYRAAGDERWPNGCLIVLVSAARRQWSGDADVELLWSDIYGVCEAWRRTAPDVDAYLVGDFLQLLDSEGLGPPPPLDQEAIRSFDPGQRFLPALKTLVSSVLEPALWWPVAEGLGLPVDSVIPQRGWTKRGRPKWGRCGVNLFPTWRPGIFIGVMLDGSDHQEPVRSHPGLGPDFHLILSYHRDASEPTTEELVTSGEYLALLRRLKADQEIWGVLDHYFEPTREPRNIWHPLHLRRPLATIIAGCKDSEESRERFVEAGLDAARHLLGGGELRAIVERYELYREHTASVSRRAESASKQS